MKLTTANIDLPAGKHDAIFFDSELSGFGLRVRRSGGDRVIRNWIIAYRVPGHQRRMVIADATKVTAAEARKRAKKELSKVELGGDPQADKQERRDKDDVSLRSVIKDFLAVKVASVRKTTLRTLKLYLEGPVGKRAKAKGIGPYLAPLHAIPIDRITRKDVAARLLAVSKQSGLSTGVVLRSTLSNLFTWAMQMGLIENNPVVGAYKPSQPKARDRVLSDPELATIWKEVEDDDYGKVIKLLILTGCRREEIARMRRPEFDFDQGTWTLPKERSKNGLPHALPITPLMREVLDSIPRRQEFDLLFGRKYGFTSWVPGKRALDAKTELKPWVVHDLRRTVSTRMNDIGIQPHIVEQILNHQSGHRRGVAGRYNRSIYEREVRDAMLRWSDHVRLIIDGGERKILPLQRPVS